MTPTPNPTAEQIVADAITAYWADEERSGPNRGPLAHDFACGEAATAALRVAGLLSEGAPSEEQIEKAANAMQNESGGFFSLESWRHLARVALTAAGVAPQEPSRLPDFFAPKPMPNSYVPAPVLPSSGVDVETLANLIHSTSVAHFGGLDPRVAPIIARVVAELLKVQGGESRGE